MMPRAWKSAGLNKLLKATASAAVFGTLVVGAVSGFRQYERTSRDRTTSSTSTTQSYQEDMRKIINGSLSLGRLYDNPDPLRCFNRDRPSQFFRAATEQGRRTTPDHEEGCREGVQSIYGWKRIRGGGERETHQTLLGSWIRHHRNPQYHQSRLYSTHNDNLTAGAKGSSLPHQNSAESYALVWSPGFISKFTGLTALWAVLHVSGGTARIGSFLSHTIIPQLSTFSAVIATTSLPNVVLPLLSSSCCLLQLAINALVGAGGCAGFNTILGPVRPFFFSLLLYLQWIAPPLPSEALLRLSLALLPELVYFWNEWSARSWKNKSKTEKGTAIKSAAIEALIEVEIPTMGCVACINKINNSLRQAAPDHQIVDAVSWLDPGKEKGGRARIHCAVGSREELYAVRRSILQSIEGAGFSGLIVSEKLEEKTKKNDV